MMKSLEEIYECLTLNELTKLYESVFVDKKDTKNNVFFVVNSKNEQIFEHDIIEQEEQLVKTILNHKLFDAEVKKISAEIDSGKKIDLNFYKRIDLIINLIGKYQFLYNFTATEEENKFYRNYSLLITDLFHSGIENVTKNEGK